MAAWPPPDPLGEALHLLRMDGGFYSRAELTAPWGMTLPAMPGHLWFHVVTSGRARLEVDDADAVWLTPGDVALVPHGRGHVLRSAAGVAAPGIMDLGPAQLTERYELIRHGGGGDPAVLVCGAVRFEHPAARSLVGLFPGTLHVAASEDPRAMTLQSAFRLMEAEARTFRPGGDAVITRLADILVIQAIRVWLESAPAAQTGWLGALRDPLIGRVLALIHGDPARDWTVAALASELAMSRSAFAARFTALVGEPAMHYVTRWRMQLARDALEREGATVGELADRLGYRSEAAFARAFKRVTGSPPGAVRRAA